MKINSQMRIYDDDNLMDGQMYRSIELFYNNILFNEISFKISLARIGN